MITIVLIVVGIVVIFALFVLLKPSKNTENTNVSDSSRLDELSRYWPIQSIEDGFLVRGDGDVTIGYNVMLPEIFKMTVNEANNIHQGFISALKLLPKGTTFHKQDYFAPDKYSSLFSEKDTFVKKANLLYYNQRPILTHYSRIFITFSVNARINKTPFSNNFNLGVDWLMKKPFTKLNDLKDNINNYTQGFENALNALNGIKLKRMDNDGLGSSLVDYYNLSYSSPCSNYKEKTLQPFLYKDFMKIGDQFVNVITLTREPERLQSFSESKVAPFKMYDNGINYNEDNQLRSSIVFPIAMGFPVNHILNTVIEIFDNEDIIQNQNQVKSSLNVGRTIKHEGTMQKQNDIELYNSTITEHNLQGCRTSVNIIVHDSDIRVLNKLNSMAKSAFSNMKNAECWIENYDNASLFFASMPGNANNNYRGFISTIQQSVCYINKESNYLSDSKGHVYIDMFGRPVVINMWDSKEITNRNKIIVGPSGTGKSFFINSLVTQSFDQGNHIVIIDIGHSYKRTCELYNGKYFDSSDKRNLSFNVFLCEKDNQGNYIFQDDDEKGEGADDKINFIITVLSVIWKGDKELLEVEKAVLSDMIKKFYDHINKNKLYPDMIEFAKFIGYYEANIIEEKRKKYFDFESLKMIIEPFVDGEYSYMLNAKTDIDVQNDKFIVFDLEAVDTNNKKIFTLVSVLIIELVIKKIKSLEGIKKTFIIDEALNFLSDKKMGDFIAYLYRTFRKKEGEVYLAMQNINFFKSVPDIIKDSIIINSDTRILLDHSRNQDSFDDLIRFGVINEGELEKIKSVRFGQAFIKMGNSSFVIKNDVSEFTEKVYTSKQTEVVQMEALFDKYQNMVVAINEYILSKNTNNSN